jgi:flagellin-like hook-associated protein FlgL
MNAFAIGIRLLIMISILAIFLGLLGCGVTITQQAAQRAVSDAQIAVSDAKASNAQLYSADKMKMAERFLKEAEEAVSRGRKQRAYTLAMRAEETAQIAEQEAKAYLEDSDIDTSENIETPVERTDVRYEPAASVSPEQPIYMPQRPVASMPPESLRYEMPSQQMPGFVAPYAPDTVRSDTQIRVQNAVKTLEEAQAAMDSARAMITKAQVEIGLSMSELTMQRLRASGVSTDMVNLVKSWYDYARRAAEAGNYEEASRAVKQAQSYAQSLGGPAR